MDESPSSAVGRASLLSLTFGTFFFDYDWTAIPISLPRTDTGRNRTRQPKVSYKQAPLLFRNLGSHKFENVSAQMGASFNRPIVARGAAMRISTMTAISTF